MFSTGNTGNMGSIRNNYITTHSLPSLHQKLTWKKMMCLDIYLEICGFEEKNLLVSPLLQRHPEIEIWGAIGPKTSEKKKLMNCTDDFLCNFLCCKKK